MKKQTIVIPEWLKGLPDFAVVSANDIFDIFGYANVGGLTNAAMRTGTFPKPDFDPSTVVSPKYNGSVNKISSGRKQKFMWRKATVMQEILRRNAELGG